MEEAEAIFHEGVEGIPVESAWYLFLGSFFILSVGGEPFSPVVTGPILDGLILLVGGRRLCEGSAHS